MKKTALIGVAFGLLVTPALAADLGARRPVYKAPSVALVYNWTGFYIGGNVGYGWADLEPGTISFFDPAFVASIPGINYELKGVIGGGQVGYNQQFGNIVLGIEGDFSGTGIKGSVTDPVNAYTATSKISWLATVRGRIGMAFDRTLVYATGGLAAARVKTTLDDLYPAGVVTTTSTANYVGWTIGGGIEFALWQNWTAKAEYLYVDLGSKDYNFYEGAAGWARISGTAPITASIARVGANLRF